MLRKIITNEIAVVGSGREIDNWYGNYSVTQALIIQVENNNILQHIYGRLSKPTNTREVGTLH